MFGRLNQVLLDIADVNSSTDSSTTTILTTVSAIQTTIGSSTDTGATATIFGDINDLQASIGTNSQSDSSSMFEQLDVIQEFADTGKSNAAAALGVAQNIEQDLGVFGATPNAYDQLRLLEEYILEIREAAENLTEGQQESGGMAGQIIQKLSEFLQQQAQMAGLGSASPDGSGAGSGKGEGEGEGEAESAAGKGPGGSPLDVDDIAKGEFDMDAVNDKLEEIDAKINALKEAMDTEDAVVRTWFESD
jgi:hypothetical protein